MLKSGQDLLMLINDILDLAKVESGKIEMYFSTMNLHEMIQYLKLVFTSKNVVGFDIVELAPIDGLHAPNFLAAKLYYKMLSYKFCSS